VLSVLQEHLFVQFVDPIYNVTTAKVSRAGTGHKRGVKEIKIFLPFDGAEEKRYKVCYLLMLVLFTTSLYV
jgi:hypothetical protein